MYRPDEESREKLRKAFSEPSEMSFLSEKSFLQGAGGACIVLGAPAGVVLMQPSIISSSTFSSSAFLSQSAEICAEIGFFIAGIGLTLSCLGILAAQRPDKKLNSYYFPPDS